MRKTEKLILVGFGIVILLLFLISSTDLVLKEFYIKPQKISVVIDDVQEENWINYKKGMEHAANLLNINVNFVILSESTKEEDQMIFINQEVKNGANAIITSPINAKRMEELLPLEVAGNIPMLVLKQPVNSENVFACFRGDYGKMGQDLGAAIKEDLKGEKEEVLIILQKKEEDNLTDYYASLTSYLQDIGLKYQRLMWDNEEELAHIYKSNKKVIVGLDEDSLVKIGNLYDKTKHLEYRIYGNGCNNTILKYLESGIIQAITVVNDFDLGYLSVMLTLNKLNGGEVYETVIIQHYLVRRETIYDEKHEKMLFPIS